MSNNALASLKKKALQENYARMLGITVLELEPGHAIVEMRPRKELTNIFDMVHGGAIFSLIDEAFELSCNSHGTIAVALNMTLTYHNAPDPESILWAESREIHRSRKTATYDIKVKDRNDLLIASCMALAYRKESPLPFLNDE